MINRHKIAISIHPDHDLNLNDFDLKIIKKKKSGLYFGRKALTTFRASLSANDKAPFSHVFHSSQA